MTPDTAAEAKGQANEAAGMAKGKAAELKGEAKGKAHEVAGEANAVTRIELLERSGDRALVALRWRG